jgi:hypothetical protein
MAKKFIIKGVGNLFVNLPCGKEVAMLGTLSDLKIDLNVEIEDIMGGDGFFPIDTLVKNKSIEVSATDAQFDLDLVRLMMGSSIIEGDTWATGDYSSRKYITKNESFVATAAGSLEKSTIQITGGATSDGDVTVSLNGSSYTVAVLTGDTTVEVANKIADAVDALAGYTASTIGSVVVISAIIIGNQVDISFVGTGTGVVGTVNKVDGSTTGNAGFTIGGTLFSEDFLNVREYSSNTVFSKTTGTPGVRQFKVVGNDIILNSSYVGTAFTVTYRSTADDIEMCDLLTNDVPFEVSIVHTGVFDQTGNVRKGIEVELFSCRAKGTFGIDATRNTASSSNVSFKVLNPARPDKRIGTIKTFTLPGNGNIPTC